MVIESKLDTTRTCWLLAIAIQCVCGISKQQRPLALFAFYQGNTLSLSIYMTDMLHACQNHELFD